MIFKFKPFQGPSRYVFKDPDTGLEYSETSKKTLISRIKAYRSQNKLEEIEFLDDVLENYWCALQENVGRCSPIATQRGVTGYLKGGVSLLRNVTYSLYTSQEEAERRAEICNKCPHNVFPNKTKFMAWIDNLAYHALGGRETSKDKNLGQCELCTCPLRVKVHMGGDLGVTPDLLKVLPEYCWQKK